MTDHETAAGVGEPTAWIWTPKDGAYELGVIRDGIGWVSEDNLCRGAESHPEHIYFLADDEAHLRSVSSRAESTEPAPAGGLREAVEALAAEWECEPLSNRIDDMAHVSTCDNCHRADRLRAALAAHPAPETPEQVQGGSEADDLLPIEECIEPDRLLDAMIHAGAWIVIEASMDTADREPPRGLYEQTVADVRAWLAARESAAATQARAEALREATQRADTAFLVGCRFGRDSERQRIEADR